MSQTDTAVRDHLRTPLPFGLGLARHRALHDVPKIDVLVVGQQIVEIVLPRVARNVVCAIRGTPTSLDDRDSRRSS